MKRILLVTVLVYWLALPSLFGQNRDGLILSLNPGAVIPMGETADHYGVGLSIDMKALYYLPKAPRFFVSGTLGYDQSTNTITDIPLSLFSLGPGAGITLSPSARLDFSLFVAGGYYLGMYNQKTGGSLYIAPGADIVFRISPGFSLGISGSYQHYFTGTDAFFNGVRATLALTFNPGGGSGQSKIEFINPSFDPVFPVFHTWYARNPVGQVTIENRESGPIEDVIVSFQVKEYMDSPTESLRIDKLPVKEKQTVPLFALFGKDILELTEGTETNAQIIVEYTVGGAIKTARYTELLPIEKRNAMTWEDDRRPASFVTANDPAVLRFSKPIAAAVREEGFRSQNENFRKAMAIFHGLTEYGIGYVVDPVTPYEELSENRFAVDFLQFPNETLTYRSGDCDDLAIMYTALLQSVNISTAFITIPGHIYMAFALDLPPDEGRKIVADPDSLIYRDGNTWVPVEITIFSDGFNEAWDFGVREWTKYNAEGSAAFYPLAEAWKTYRPVDSPFDDTDINPPDIDTVMRSYKAEYEAFVRRNIAGFRVELEHLIRDSNNNPRYVNRLGILYARYGLHDEAVKTLTPAADRNYLPSVINLANIAFLEERYDEALEMYRRAQGISPDSPAVMVGMAKSYYEMENYGAAREIGPRLERISPNLVERYAYLFKTAETTTRAGTETARRLVEWSED